jgi:hypothetical protein
MRLGSVLSGHDLPVPELGALVLDGEAFRLGDCFASIDEASGPFLRASALGRELPPRLIAEQHTAAWVWGAVARPPARHEVCADTSARTRPAFEERLRVREVIILHDDVTVLAGTAVTIPMRTAIDLARFVETWSDEETHTLAQLLQIAGCTVLDCARAMNRKRNLPNKRIALERLALCAP